MTTRHKEEGPEEDKIKKEKKIEEEIGFQLFRNIKNWTVKLQKKLMDPKTGQRMEFVFFSTWNFTATITKKKTDIKEERTLETETTAIKRNKAVSRGFCQIYFCPELCKRNVTIKSSVLRLNRRTDSMSCLWFWNLSDELWLLSVFDLTMRQNLFLF